MSRTAAGAAGGPSRAQEDDARSQRSVHHHHDHDHHHHHSHYERQVDEHGTVHETTITEDIVAEKPIAVVAVAAAVDGGAAAGAVAAEAGAKKKNKKKKKGKAKAVEEVDGTIDEVVAPAFGLGESAPIVVATVAPSVVQPVAAPTLPPPTLFAAPSVRAPSFVAPAATVEDVPDPEAADVVQERDEEPLVQTTKTVTTTTVTRQPLPKEPSEKAPSLRAPSIRARSVRAPSIKAPTVITPPSAALTAVAPLNIAPPVLPALSALAPAPPSPTPSHGSVRSVRSYRSHRSHRSHHHPEVIVNVNVPPAPAPVAFPPPAELPPPLTLAPPAPVAPPVPSQRTPSIIAPVPVPAAAIPLPASVASAPPSPAGSVRSMRLPKSFRCEPKAPSVAYVQEVPEELPEDQDQGDVVTKTVTTVTTTRRVPTPPKTPTPPPALAAPPAPVPYVINDPSWVPPRPPAARVQGNTISMPAIPITPPTPVTPPPLEITRVQGGSPGFVETTTVETVTYPIATNTAAATLGNPTTMGMGGARTAAPGPAGANPMPGTKGGLTPIPMVDFAALIRATPPRWRHALPAPPATTAPPPPAAPQTVLTMSADLERDSRGNEHLHATVRDHTGMPRAAERTGTPEIRARDMAAPTVPAVLPPMTLARGDAIDGAATAPAKREKRRKKKDKNLEEEIDVELEEGIHDVVEDVMAKADRRERTKRAHKPVYQPLGGLGLPPPRSERYAYPPEPNVIEQNARQRFMGRVGMGGPAIAGRPLRPPMPGMPMPPGGPGIGVGMGMGSMYGGGGGPPFPPPGPMTMPRPPPLMGSRPPMTGPPMMNPMMMQPGMMGGMGLMGAPMPGMGVPYSPGAGMGMGGMGMGMGLGMGGYGFGR